MQVDTDIVLIKLTNGDDIISKSIENNMENESNHFILFEPKKIVYYTDDNKIKIALLPWIFNNLTDDRIFKIYTSEVITTMKPSENLISIYLKSIENLKIVDDNKEEEIEIDYQITDSDLSKYRVLH